MTNTIKVIDKAFHILNSFDETNKSVRLKELSQITSLNKSTILRICDSLIKHNFLVKNEINGSYSLGPGTWKIGSIYNSNFKIGEEIKYILNGGKSKIGVESTIINLLDILLLINHNNYCIINMLLLIINNYLSKVN